MSRVGRSSRCFVDPLSLSGLLVDGAFGSPYFKDFWGKERYVRNLMRAVPLTLDDRPRFGADSAECCTETWFGYWIEPDFWTKMERINGAGKRAECKF